MIKRPFFSLLPVSCFFQNLFLVEQRCCCRKLYSVYNYIINNNIFYNILDFRNILVTRNRNSVLLLPQGKFLLPKCYFYCFVTKTSGNTFTLADMIMYITYIYTTICKRHLFYQIGQPFLQLYKR